MVHYKYSDQVDFIITFYNVHTVFSLLLSAFSNDSCGGSGILVLDLQEETIFCKIL